MSKAVGVSLKDVLESGLRASDYSAWHSETPAGLPFDHYHHASGLAYCPRKLILGRAGLATDGKPFEGAMTLRQGTVAHTEIERCIQTWVAEEPVDREIIVQEVGYYHPDMPLASKPDALIGHKGTAILVDFKTEHELAVKRRREEAKAAGRITAAKYEHQIQLTATAMVLEANGFTVDEGRIWYLSKSAWWPDDQPVDVKDPDLRREVKRKVAVLEMGWVEWQHRGALPHRLPDGDWQCRPRKDEPPKGMYCEARSVCMSEKMPP